MEKMAHFSVQGQGPGVGVSLPFINRQAAKVNFLKSRKWVKIPFKSGNLLGASNVQ